MPEMPPTFRPRGSASRRDQSRAYDHHRGSSRERGYDARWEKARAAHLQQSPLCEYCLLNEDRAEPANTVDHLYPHKGCRILFWRTEYWVSSCGPCHSGFKQQVEAEGRIALDRLAVRLGRIPMGEGG